MEMTRVCMILEGSYPYVRGGVSTWMHDYLNSDTKSTYSLWTICADKEDEGNYRYELPSNVPEVSEICLGAAYDIEIKATAKTSSDIAAIADAFRKIIINNETEPWDVVFERFQSNAQLTELFSSPCFLKLAEDLSQAVGGLGLSDAFYGLRTMLLPVAYVLTQPIPPAHIYHSASAGYSGLLGAMAAYRERKPFVLTEHGIYPREREEELMLAEWIHPALRKVWVKLFYNMSLCAYEKATLVTSLFDGAKQRQIEIGCPPEKCRVIANGIRISDYISIPKRSRNKEIQIGAFVRFSPIKDIKTLISAFCELVQNHPNVHLHIMGGIDDDIYYRECMDLISILRIKNIHIDGYVNTCEAMKSIDFSVLSSISEGQPLSVIESLAAARPCVVTNVGNCNELLICDGECAGICVQPMNPHEMAVAMQRLVDDYELREHMGEIGRAKAKVEFAHEIMMKKYTGIYKEVEEEWQASGLNLEKQ